MEGRLIINVIVRKGARILQLFAGKDDALMYGADAFHLIELHLDAVDGI